MIKLSEDDIAVRFTDVCKSYEKRRVVDQLCFEVRKGMVFGLIGPNGAGKSTSLKALMGLLKLDSGSIELFGNDVDEVFLTPQYGDLRQRVGYVPEVHSIYRWMKINEAIRFVKSFYATWNDSLADELLNLFQLDKNRRVKHLSKGMLAKLGLLLAAAHEPELLILDEPTSGLDPLVREEFVHGVLRSAVDQEQTVIFSSHSIDDVQRLADTVGVLQAGKLVVHDDVESILKNTKRLRVSLKDNCSPAWTPGSAIWHRFEDRLWELTVNNFSDDLVAEVQQKNSVEQIDVSDLSLEEIFKDYARQQRKTEAGNA